MILVYNILNYRTENIPLKTKLEEGDSLNEKSKKHKKRNKKLNKLLKETTADIDMNLRDTHHKNALRALILVYISFLMKLIS